MQEPLSGRAPAPGKGDIRALSEQQAQTGLCFIFLVPCSE
jgi:hypothetical protein